MDANPFTADALAAAAADGDRVCLSNLLVRHRKRRGAKMFFATASAEAGWDVQLSFMTRRGKAHDDAETSARLTPEAHAAAYEGCAPGATIDKVWGALERGRVVSAAETDAREVAREADDTSDFAFDDGANVLRVKTSADVRGRSCRPAPFTAMVTLRVDRVEFAAPPRRFGRSGDPTDVRDAAAVDGPDPDCWLVFDMAYDATMTDAEHGGLSRQITMCVAANKRAKVPFRLAVVADGTLAEPNASRANENERERERERENEAASSRRVTLKKKNDQDVFGDDDALGVARAPRGARGAGATGEGSRRVPDSSNASSDCAVTSSASKTRPHRLWRALPWRAWGAPRISPETFFSAAGFFFGDDARATGAAPRRTRDEKHDDEQRTQDEHTKTCTSPRRVIYLSADAENTLETIEPGDVFVLGGVVDHSPKPALARRRFDTLRETFFFSESARDASARDAVAFSTLRLPLAGHVSLAKNAHLPCLAVAQTLMVFRRVHRSREREKEKESRRGPTPSGDVSRRRDAEPGRAPWPEKEGGANASVWGETLARCPAFRCAPLRKYVRWAPPYEALNEKEGEVKPSRVTDVDALF